MKLNKHIFFKMDLYNIIRNIKGDICIFIPLYPCVLVNFLQLKGETNIRKTTPEKYKHLKYLEEYNVHIYNCDFYRNDINLDTYITEIAYYMDCSLGLTGTGVYIWGKNKNEDLVSINKIYSYLLMTEASVSLSLENKLLQDYYFSFVYLHTLPKIIDCNIMMPALTSMLVKYILYEGDIFMIYGMHVSRLTTKQKYKDQEGFAYGEYINKSKTMRIFYSTNQRAFPLSSEVFKYDNINEFVQINKMVKGNRWFCKDGDIYLFDNRNLTFYDSGYVYTNKLFDGKLDQNKIIEWNSEPNESDKLIYGEKYPDNTYGSYRLDNVRGSNELLYYKTINEELLSDPFVEILYNIYLFKMNIINTYRSKNVLSVDIDNSVDFDGRYFISPIPIKNDKHESIGTIFTPKFPFETIGGIDIFDSGRVPYHIEDFVNMIVSGGYIRICTPDMSKILKMMEKGKLENNYQIIVEDEKYKYMFSLLCEDKEFWMNVNYKSIFSISKHYKDNIFSVLDKMDNIEKILEAEMMGDSFQKLYTARVYRKK